MKKCAAQASDPVETLAVLFHRCERLDGHDGERVCRCGRRF